MASLFTSQTPVGTNNSDGTPGITTGTSVVFAQGGLVNAVSFRATTTVSGTYTGALWQVTSSDSSPSGNLLASKVRPTAPTAGAWNLITFDTPVAVTTGVLYRVGVHSSDGRYVNTEAFPPFVGGAGGLTNGDIWAPHTGDDPVGLGSMNQGVFAISSTLGYPASTFNASCYFVDVDFTAGVVAVARQPIVVPSGAVIRAASY